MSDIVAALLFIGFATVRYPGQRWQPRVQFALFLAALVFAVIALATTEGWI